MLILKIAAKILLCTFNVFFTLLAISTSKDHFELGIHWLKEDPSLIIPLALSVLGIFNFIYHILGFIFIQKTRPQSFHSNTPKIESIFWLSTLLYALFILSIILEITLKHHTYHSFGIIAIFVFFILGTWQLLELRSFYKNYKAHHSLDTNSINEIGRS